MRSMMSLWAKELKYWEGIESGGLTLCENGVV